MAIPNPSQKDNLTVILFGVLCLLGCIDLFRQYYANSLSYYAYEYARGVQSNSEFWEIGYNLEEMEYKIKSEREFMEQIEKISPNLRTNLRNGMEFSVYGFGSSSSSSSNTGFSSEHEHFLVWRQARSIIQKLLYNDSRIYQILCGDNGSPLRVGLNDFRMDERDMCNIFTAPTDAINMESDNEPNSAGAETMFEMIDANTDGEFYLRALSNNRFLTVERKPDSYEWKLIVGGPVAGAAEKFRLSQDGILYSPLIKGGFTCGNGKAVFGYQGPYNNFDKFVFKEVSGHKLQRGYELSDLSNKILNIQNEYGKEAKEVLSKMKKITILNKNKNIAETDERENHEKITKIAITVPMTSKNTDMQSIADSPFFANLFDSFMKTIDWRSNRFVFRFFLGFDKADLMYDTGDAWSEMREEFVKRATFHMSQQLMDADTIKNVFSNQLSIQLMHFEHLEGAPTQVVSQLALKAYDDDFDYFYQVNDDTILLTPNWATSLIKVLSDNPYIPNFGVTGPKDTNNDLIFTHAFVHRLHIEIFGHLFPTSFKNWWSDDWITTVYGYEHTFTKSGVEIQHNVQSQKLGGSTRYDIDQGAQLRLNDELRRGHVQIDEWLRKNNLPRLPLPVICGYIPLVSYAMEALRSQNAMASMDHEETLEKIEHHG